MKIKIDIENKILIPFMILIIISIFSMSAVSFYSSYEMLLNNESKNCRNDLKEAIIINNNFILDSKNEIEAKKNIINFYKNAGKKNLIILNSDKVVLNTYDLDGQWIGEIKTADINEELKIIYEEDYIFVYEYFDKYDWIMGYRLNKDLIFNEVLENEKNMILVAIVCLIFSMEAAILISYNISKPVKKLAKYCDDIVDYESYDEKIEIKRNDEIGILSNAFNNMLVRIKEKIDKITEVTKFNEDILKNIPAGIVTTDENGRLLTVNEAAKNLLHENTEKNVDINIMEKLLEQLKRTLESDKIINEVLFFNDMDGNKIYLDVTTSILIGNEGSKDGAICNFNDISERKKFENNMDILDRLTSIGQFAAGIAHEIRNPLTGMKTSIQVLKNRLCKDENISNDKLFNGIIHEIDRINVLITNLLNFAKPRVPDYQKTDLPEVLNRTLDLVRKHAEENNIKINIKVMSKNKTIYADKSQIEQIFLNIIKNSMTAIKKDGAIDICFNEIINENGNFIVVDFQDDGCGISIKDMNKIFNPFFTTSNQGTGLGLSVVYELVKSNNGKIEIQSILNEGTKVQLEFVSYRGA